MDSRHTIKEQIVILGKEQAQLETEGEAIEKQKEIYKVMAKQQNRTLYPVELLHLGEMSVKYRQKMNAINHSLRSLHLLNALQQQEESAVFERIVIGGGIAATMVYNELPPDYRDSRRSGHLPPVLVLSDPSNPHTWPKEGERLMGQPALVQTPPTLSARPESFALQINKASNPYEYTVAEHFDSAIKEAQNNMDMPLVSLKAIEIQSKASLTTAAPIERPWEHDSYQHRVVVNLDNKGTKKYLYTHALDFCIGLGQPNELSNTQIDPTLASKLVAEKKLLYAQDGDMNLHGNVIFYGGSAINAAWIAEIVAGHSSHNANFNAWITPRAQSFENARKLNRMIASAMTTHKDYLATGSIESITELANGQLELTIADFKPYQNDSATAQNRKIICDQCVVSIGQKKNELVNSFENFVPRFYLSPEGKTSQIPLGTTSPDQSIVFWGAAGTLGVGLSAAAQEEFVRLVGQHARSFPHESHALGGIYRSYWTIMQMAKQLQSSHAFPYSSQHKIHYLLPDINLAPLEELKTVIAKAGSYSDLQCEFYAKKIINLRSAPKSTKTYDLPGIFSTQALKGLNLPLDVIKVLRTAFFPFEARTALSTASGKNKKTSQVSATSSLGFFSSTQRTEDADIFISQASHRNDDTFHDKKETVAQPKPLVVGGKRPGSNNNPD